MANYRCRVRGHSATILDWTIGFHVDAVTGLAAVIASAVADGFSDLWDGVPSGTNALKTLYDVATLADDVVVDEFFVSFDAQGKPHEHNVQQGRSSLVLAGTAVDEPLPPNVSVVGSKTTILPTRQGRGRVYFPPPTLASVDSGKIAAASVAIYANAWKNFLHSVATAAGGAYTPVIFHPTGDPAEFTEIVGIRVGDVFDTQRRRRNKLKEAYTELSIA